MSLNLLELALKKTSSKSRTPVSMYQIDPFLKWYYDENRIFPIEAILRRKQVFCMRRKMPFTFSKYLFSFQRYSSF